eukprot:522719-Lingulodinium_polyedra.AAC.1
MGPYGVAPGTNARRPAPPAWGAAGGRCWLRPRPAHGERRHEPAGALGAARNGHCRERQGGSWVAAGFGRGQPETRPGSPEGRACRDLPAGGDPA